MPAREIALINIFMHLLLYPYTPRTQVRNAYVRTIHTYIIHIHVCVNCVRSAVLCFAAFELTFWNHTFCA